jgi:glutaredoxin 3
MHQFTVYKTDTCPYCTQAQAFLDALVAERGDVAVKYIDANSQPQKFRAMAQRTHTSTVPQIFVDGTHVGGWDQLARAAGSGRLDTLFDTGAWPEVAKPRGLFAKIFRR